MSLCYKSFENTEGTGEISHKMDRYIVKPVIDELLNLHFKKYLVFNLLFQLTMTFYILLLKVKTKK